MSGLYEFMFPQVRWWPEHYIESANVHGAPHCIADYVYVGIPTNSGKFHMKHFLYWAVFQWMHESLNEQMILFVHEWDSDFVSSWDLFNSNPVHRLSSTSRRCHRISSSFKCWLISSLLCLNWGFSAGLVPVSLQRCVCIYKFLMNTITTYGLSK